MKHVIPIAFCGILAITAACCFFQVHALANSNGNLSGLWFAIFGVPFGFVLSVLCFVLAGVQKSRVAGFLSLVPVVALTLPILFGYNLSLVGWSRAISQHATANETAVSMTDFSTAEFEAIPYKDHERMVPVDGFVWPNADEMITANQGVFSGFAVDGVPHVYLFPIKNGCQGVAWLESKDIMRKDPRYVRYEYSGTTNWYIWTMSGEPFE